MRQPLSLNRYIYVTNNPVNLYDPDGRAQVCISCTGGGISDGGGPGLVTEATPADELFAIVRGLGFTQKAYEYYGFKVLVSAVSTLVDPSDVVAANAEAERQLKQGLRLSDSPSPQVTDPLLRAIDRKAYAELVMGLANNGKTGGLTDFQKGFAKGAGVTALIAGGVIAAFAVAALFVATPVLIAAGAVLAVGGASMAYRGRVQEQQQLGMKPAVMPTLGVAVLDVLGVAPLWEGYRRERLLTGMSLDDETAGELMGAGVVGIAAWMAGPKLGRAVQSRVGPAVARMQAKLPGRPLSRERVLFHADADPLRKYGSASQTHPEELAAAFRELEAAGVEIIRRPNAMGYAPATTPGRPGQFFLDPEASYGALLHEMSHFADDMASGFPGMRGMLANPHKRWGMEYKAYMKEIRLARALRDFDVGRQLVRLMRQEKARIFSAP